MTAPRWLDMSRKHANVEPVRHAAAKTADAALPRGAFHVANALRYPE